MKTLVLGLGKSGKSALAYLGDRGIGYDDQSPKELDWDQIEEVVLSPGVPQTHPHVVKAQERKIPILSEIELGLRDYEGVAIGVTGTNGKTTVTLLLAHILGGLATGNCGVPFTSHLDHPLQVIELSSYQLETTFSKKLEHSLLLNLSPDHLDRYPHVEAYYEAKMRIADLTKGTFFSFSGLGKGEPFFPLEIEGARTFADNVGAAYAVAKKMGISDLVFEEKVRSFILPQHRLEYLGEKQGIHFINDSKGTNLDATVRAVQMQKGDVILMAGGQEKGDDFAKWRVPFQNKVKNVVAFGAARNKIERALGKDYPLTTHETLEEALEKALHFAKRGDTILFSPGCASFDAFANYEERGDFFRKLFMELGQ